MPAIRNSRIAIELSAFRPNHLVPICGNPVTSTHWRKFQLKMGLSTLIQIPCHHVLANEIALNLKYRIGLKHFFNINLGLDIIKKTTFLFVFLTYLLVFLPKFRSGELVGCGIKFRIQQVPIRHTFDGPRYPKKRNT